MKIPVIGTVLCLIALGLSHPSPAQLNFGPGKEAGADSLDTIVAVVDSDVITRRELNNAMAAIEQQLKKRNTPLPPHDVLEHQVLERLILNQLELRAAEKNTVTVDDPTLNSTLEELARRNNLTLSQMRQAIERDGLSFAQFREDIRRELLSNRLRQKVVDSHVQLSEQEVDALISQMSAHGNGGNSDNPGRAQEYHIAQILIAVAEGATPEQIEAARGKARQVLEKLRQGADFRSLAIAVSADRQALEGGDLGWRRADQLPTLFAEVVPRLQPGQLSDLIRSPSGFHIVKLLEVKGGETSANASQPRNDASLQITQTHARHILIKTNEQVSDDEARQRLQRLRERIASGEDFATLAKANSDDTSSAARGGELNWIGPGDTAPEFETVLNGLKPNELSQPFKTRYGWHLVQVLERRQAEGGKEALRAKARETLFKRRVEEEWEQWLRRLRDEAYVEVRLQPLDKKP